MLFFITGGLIIMLPIYIYTYTNVENYSYNRVLFNYQLGKLTQAKDTQVVLIGDSSLGNAIDANYFSHLTGLPTLNLALTRLHGYAGSYNMLKHTINNCPKLHTAVLVQTIDMLSYPIYYKGYTDTSPKLSELFKFEFSHQKKIITQYLTIKNQLNTKLQMELGLQKLDTDIIRNDYIKQGKKINTKNINTQLDTSSINLNKLYFLKKIKKLCFHNNIQLLYIAGPVFKDRYEQSEDYVNKTFYLINQQHISTISELVLMANSEIGDSPNHVKPEYKKKFTEKYANILTKYIKAN